MPIVTPPPPFLWCSKPNTTHFLTSPLTYGRMKCCRGRFTPTLPLFSPFLSFTFPNSRPFENAYNVVIYIVIYVHYIKYDTIRLYKVRIQSDMDYLLARPFRFRLVTSPSLRGLCKAWPGTHTTPSSPPSLATGS